MNAEQMPDRLPQKTDRLINSSKLPWIIIGIGTVLRIYRYLYNPSLWFDESDIAIDFISRPFSEIIHPSPDYTQAYPYAFLIVMKLLTHLLGNSEYAIRLFPLLTGILSLFLFYRIAKSYLEPKAFLIALGLFAALDPLIFESSNLKPYSGDVFFALLMYSLGIYIYARELNMPRVILFGLAGAIAIWFSNPSILILAGLGLCLLVFAANNKEWLKAGKLIAAYSMWLASFVANYFYYIRNLKASFGMSMELMLRREDAYMPIPPKSISDLKWFSELFLDIFNYPVEITFTGIAALAFIVGCFSLYSTKRKTFFILIAPATLAFLAGMLHQYPFRDRFIFFLLPFILLILAEGAEYVRSRSVQSSKIVGVIFLILLFFHPIVRSANRIIRPFAPEEMRPVLKYVKDHWQKGDVIYVHYYAQYPFEYYSKYYPQPYRFNENEYIIGIAPRGWYRHWRKQDVFKYYDPGAPIDQSSMEIFKLYARDLDQLKGKMRVWVLFTSAIPKDGILEEKFFVYHLETIGKRLGSFGNSGKTTVYLYDLSSGPLADNK